MFTYCVDQLAKCLKCVYLFLSCVNVCMCPSCEHAWRFFFHLCHKHQESGTLQAGYTHGDSLNFAVLHFSFNQNWHTALCGALGQLEDCFCCCIIMIILFLLSHDPMLINFAALCRGVTCSASVPAPRLAWINGITSPRHQWNLVNETFGILNPRALTIMKTFFLMV